MRRLVTLAILLFFTIPFGISLAGCAKKTTVVFCNGENSGVVVGQLATLDLEPRLTGISLNEGQIGTVGAPTGKDCKGTTESATGLAYGSTNMSLADVVPTTGRLCAGTWNRNTGGGVADFTFCTPAAASGVAYVTASSGGVTSNAIPVFIHPTVTSILLGPASTNCTTDPASNCIDLNLPVGTTCDSGPVTSAITAYDGSKCITQGQTSQLVARVYSGSNTALAANNISCQVGPVTFSANSQTTTSSTTTTASTASSVVTIDTNGLATAAQPGSTTINAATSQSSSSAGFFSTCPPKSVILTTSGASTPPTAPIAVNQNVPFTLVANVLDTNNATITNVPLTYVSTAPTTIPAAAAIITPTFPGSAAITALCQPPTCNSSAFNEIGLFGTGLPVTSNPVNLTATGTNNSTILYILSTASQYILPLDFTVTTQPSPVRLPYVPNSAVLTQDLSTIYMGTPTEIMVYSTTTNAVTKEDTSLSGTVLSAAPNSTTVVVTDPVRKLTYLYTSTGAITTEYGGVATSAQWTPDSSTVYITTSDGRLLVYSTFTGWNPVALPNLATSIAVTVPQAGVYLGNNTGSGTVSARTNCPTTTVTGTFPNTNTTNVFYPLADTTTANASQVAATNDGRHILGASTTAFTDVTTNQKSGACPIAFTSTTGTPLAFSGIAATAVNGVLPTSDSAYAFVTFNGTGGLIPEYIQSTTTGTPGRLANITLQKTSGGTPVAPVAGVVSSDNQTVYIGTSGDNAVHRLLRGATGFTDTGTPIIPALPAFTGGGNATPNMLLQKPRSATS